MTRPWVPLLVGERHRRARTALERIANTLLATERTYEYRSGGTPKLASVLTGHTGQALAHAYLARCDLGDGHEQRAEVLLERGLAEIGDVDEGGLLKGYASPAFAVEHLCGDPSDEDDANAHVDAALLEELGVRQDLPHDYMVGIAGRAVYARERTGYASGESLYRALAQRLLETAERSSEGTRWRRAPDLRYVDPAEARDLPDGWYDLRVAWGMVGTIAILGRCTVHPEARATTLDAMRWIWGQRAPGTEAMFPMIVGASPKALSGWCIGDVGLSAVLYSTALALGDETWTGRWLEVFRITARRPADPDRGLALCHGATGVAHMFARAYQTCGDDQIRDAALRWYDVALDLAERSTDDLPTGFLNGLGGVALALAAGITDVAPDWDRLLLLS